LAAAKATQMVPGAFHFLERRIKVPGFALVPAASAADQADNFIDTVVRRNGTSGNILLCLDIEDETLMKTNPAGKKVAYLKSRPRLADVDEWFEQFRYRLPDAYLLMYTSRGKWDGFGNPKFHARYDGKVRLWLATWIGHADFTLRLGGLKPAIHQYTGGDGILYRHAHSDLDASWLTKAQLISLANWDLNPYPPPPPPPTPADNEPEIGCPDETSDGAYDPPDMVSRISIADTAWAMT
jgi:hypothetical protein